VARAVLGLVAVVALAVVFVRLLGARVGRGRTLEVVERLPLERGRTLWVVRAPGKVLLLATGPAGTETVAELDPDEVARALEAAPDDADAPWWARLLAGRAGRGEP